MNPHSNTPEGLLTAKELRTTVWHPDAAPSLRTIREWQAKKMIPWVKIGRLVFFDPAKVRQAIAKRFTVEAAS